MVKKKQHDIRIKQGEDFTLAFVVRDTDGNAVNLTGASVTAQLREYPENGDQYDFTCRHNNAGGRVTMTMPKELTSIIAYSYGTYDVFVTYANGTVENVLWGRVFIISEVTRVQAGTQQIVLAFTSFEDFPEVGNLYRLYLDCDAGLLYRWTGTQYVNALEGLRGDKGDDGRGILEIRKIATSENGLVDTYELEYTDGETWLFYVHNGNGILTIQKVGTAGLVDTYRISMQDGTYTDFEVTNGSGIRTISKTRSVGLTDIYTIYFENGNKTTFSVTNGRDGAGSIVWVEDRVAHVRTLNTLNIDDIPGLYERLKGDKGDRGNGIVSIELTGTSGRNKTYTITYDDETTSTFVVTDGATGQQGTAATIEVTGVNTLSAGTPAYVQEDTGSTAQNRKLIFGIPQGPQGDPGQAGTSVPWSGITGSPTDNAALVTKLDEYLPRVTTYYNTNVIDSMTDGTVLVSLSSTVNASLYNALDDNFAYVIQFYYNSVGADRNHVQIAFPYSANKSKMAWRSYKSSTWGDWQVVDASHTPSDYVLKSGDTMTGTLKIEQGDTWLKSTAIDGTEAPATSTNTPSLRFIDKNNQTLGLININQPVTNILKMQLAMRHYINGTWTYKYPLQLMLDTSGNVSYSVANAENFRTAIDAAATSHNHDSAYVNISGDTMTDSLSIKKSAYDISASSISALTDTIYAVKDKNNRNLCYLRGQQQTNGDVSIDIRARRYNNNANVDNYLFLKVATDGTRSVSVSDATIWRNALGASSGVWSTAQGGTGNTEGKAASAVKLAQNRRIITYLGNKYDANSSSSNYNGQWDLSGNTAIPVYGTLGLANGGTGGTDSEWQSFTNSSVFTGTITYRKIGAFCFMTGAIKLANNLTSDYIDLGTMPSGYRPNTNSVYGFGGGQDDLGVLRITNGGAIRFFKTAQVSTWSTNANIYFQFSYFCA